MPFDNGAADQQLSKEEIISKYFYLGFTYMEILEFLLIYHNITIGVRQLHRLLREIGLRRHQPYNNRNDIFDAIEQELAGSGRYLGYRGMQSKLRLSHGIILDRETIKQILKLVDSDECLPGKGGGYGVALIPQKDRITCIISMDGKS
jgi:hypothetical protein